MNGRSNGCRGFFTKHKRTGTLIGCVVVILAIAAIGFNLTKDKAQKTISKSVKVENKNSEDMSANPLKLDNYPEVTKVVQDYYSSITENTDFVEGYNQLNVYTKVGKYEDSYVVYARYDMKIKNVYTEVPGLETLYVEKEKDTGNLKVTEIKDEEMKSYIDTITSHDDVKELMASVQTAYTAAVDSDALLKEVLQDLQTVAQTKTDEPLE